MTILDYETDRIFIRQFAHMIGAETLAFTRENKIYFLDKKKGIREITKPKFEDLELEVLRCQL